MPELPEIEYAAERLATAVRGKTLHAVRALHPAMGRTLDPHAAAQLAGHVVQTVERRGKYQLLHLSGDMVLVAHFRMAGDWHPGRVGEVPRHARGVLEFTDGSAVFLVDSRAFATLVVRTAGAEGVPELGPDAADSALTGEKLRVQLAGRRGAIKPLLLDQRVLAGLGNIYAAEALWHAAISPFASPVDLSDAELTRLAFGIESTIAAARKDPGRYSRGEALDRLAVYGREGDACSRCTTAIARVTQAGRSTFYCPGCQTATAR